MARKPPARKTKRPVKGKGRSASKGRKSKRRVASRKAKKARARKAAKANSPLRRAARWTAKWTAVVGLGAALGVSVVVAVQYRQAVNDVEELLGGQVWSSSGRVMSAPMELWTGLRLSPEDLATDLQAAGYARVSRAQAPGDFEVVSDAILVKVAAGSWPGGTARAGDVLLTFSGDRISSVSPGSRVTLAPAELAGVRGGDNEARRVISLADVPPHVSQAVLAMEDARFYDHEGLDPLGIARALLVNAWRGSTAQGGSTLTQQVVKNLFLTQERTLERKAREAVLAMALEARRSKDDILELYLNEIYLGQAGGVAICGIDQAARAYFGKPAERLEVGEAATLAGIVSAPNRYSPLRHPQRALERRDIALGRMADVGFLAPSDAEVLKREPLTLHPSGTSRRAPWAVDAAVEGIEQAMGEGTVVARGVSVHTTIQPALQRLAERAVVEGLAELEQIHPTTHGAQAAIAVVRVRDGAVVALVGSRDYATSQFDRATHGSRQIGSTVKPLTALLAFEEDSSLSPATVLEDSYIERVVDGKTWAPRNYDGSYRGPLTLREALRVSRNIPAVLLSERAGLKTLERGWRELGLDEASSNPSAALGSFGATPLELAGAYTVFPGGGRWSQPTLVRSALDESGALLWEQEPIRLRRTSAESAWLVGSMLQDVVRSGTGAKASVYGAAGYLGGKTGTTDGARDAWFVGYSAEYAVAVWVGFDRDRVLGLTGGQAALPTWARFMAWSGTGGTSFPRPAGLQFVEGCVACDPMGVCLDEDGEWFRSGQAPEACGDDDVFGLQPGEESMWAVLQERIEARKAERAVSAEETRRERRRRRRDG